MPVVVQRSGRLQAVAGTMGGYAQPQIDAEVLIRAVDLAMPPDEAVAAPRWIVGGSSETGAPSAVAEADVGAQVLDRLAGAGFRVETVAERDGSLGHAQLILTRSDGFDAGSDPRADGGAAAS